MADSHPPPQPQHQAQTQTPSRSPHPDPVKPLLFYDISSPLAPRSYAPNPSKTRIALSSKQLPFTTVFTDILDIPSTRQALSCPAGRQFDDGSDFYTLPVLVDPNTEPQTVIGDSFEITTYLDAQYPDSGAGRLFPPDSTGYGLDYVSPAAEMAKQFYAPLSKLGNIQHEEYAKFNAAVDATFTSSMGAFGYNLPFNPDTAERAKALFAKRAHLPSWEVLNVTDPATRRKMLDEFKVGIEGLAQLFLSNSGGVFLEGERASYADLIVGGWLNCFSVVMPKAEWEEFSGQWFGGVFGRLHERIQKEYFDVSQ